VITHSKNEHAATGRVQCKMQDLQQPAVTHALFGSIAPVI